MGGTNTELGRDARTLITVLYCNVQYVGES